MDKWTWVEIDTMPGARMMSQLHPLDEDSLQTIDALLFSGDPNIADLARVEYFLARWARRIADLKRNV